MSNFWHNFRTVIRRIAIENDKYGIALLALVFSLMGLGMILSSPVGLSIATIVFFGILAASEFIGFLHTADKTGVGMRYRKNSKPIEWLTICFTFCAKFAAIIGCALAIVNISAMTFFGLAATAVAVHVLGILAPIFFTIAFASVAVLLITSIVAKCKDGKVKEIMPEIFALLIVGFSLVVIIGALLSSAILAAIGVTLPPVVPIIIGAIVLTVAVAWGIKVVVDIIIAHKTSANKTSAQIELGTFRIGKMKNGVDPEEGNWKVVNNAVGKKDNESNLTEDKAKNGQYYTTKSNLTSAGLFGLRNIKQDYNVRELGKNDGGGYNEIVNLAELAS